MKRILVVDDSPTIRQQVSLALRQAGFEVQEAVDGVDALTHLATPAAAMICDVNMPRMNGIEFLRALRADPALQPTPVVMLTTSNDDRDRVEAYRLNVAGYLVKPVTFAAFTELMTALDRYWTLVELP